MARTRWQCSANPGSLLPGGWQPLSGRAGFTNGWGTTTATVKALLEQNASSFTAISAGADFDYGVIFNTANAKNLVFKYTLDTGTTITGTVNYTAVPEPTGLTVLAAGAAMGLLGRRRWRHAKVGNAIAS